MSTPQQARRAQTPLIAKEEPRETSPLAFRDSEKEDGEPAGSWHTQRHAEAHSSNSAIRNTTIKDKKPRLLFDCVCLPRVRDVYTKVLKKEEDVKPKIEVKKKDEEAIQLPPHLLDLRLKGLRTYDVDGPLRAAGLDPAIKNIAVHRRLLAQDFGGNIQKTFTNRAKHFVAFDGITQEFTYPIMTVNPHAPTVPGHPGLFFSADFENDDELYVVVGLGRNQWLVVGLYRFSDAGCLTLVEWAAVTPTAQRAWAGHILRDKWGARMRKRICLRRQLGRPLAEEEENRHVVNDGLLNSLTEDDIVDAVSRGDEKIDVYTMECIGYNVEMARRIAELYNNGRWTPRSSEEQKAFLRNLKANMPHIIERKPKVRKEVESEMEESDDE